MKPLDTDIFYIPCAYLHRVRLGSTHGRILSWWFLLIVPTMGYGLLMLPALSWSAIGSYMLLLMAVVPYYELGYMYNDTFTTRREANPTRRLSNEQTSYFYQHVAAIVGCRMLWVFGMLGLYGMLSSWSSLSLVTMGAVLLLQVIFAIYNRIRGLAAVCFYPVLISWRYLVFLLPCGGSEHFALGVGLCLLAYPLEISIERFSMPRKRYGIMAVILSSEAAKTGFRAYYYAVIGLLLLPLWIHLPIFGLPILAIALYRWLRLFAAKRANRYLPILFGLLMAQGLKAESLPRVNLVYSALDTDTFSAGTFELVHDSTTITLPMQVRHRGNTATIYDKPSYAVKLYDATGAKQDTALLGMRSDNYWILDAMAVDKARMRNRVAMDLWLQFSRKPWYQELEPKMVNGYRGQMVEVYVNGSPQGIYCLMERVDRKQLKLKKYAPDKGVRGLLYKSFANYRTVYYNLWSTPNPALPTWDGWEQKYPDADDQEPVSWDRFYHHIYVLVRTYNNSLVDTAQIHLDMPVYIDYVLFCQLLAARDNVSKNIHISFYDATTERALYTPWDLDHSWGRQFNSSEESSDVTVRFIDNYLYKRMNSYYPIQDTLEARYAELRRSYFTIEHIDSLFTPYFDLYARTGMDTVEQRLWSGHNGIEFDIPSEQQYIHNWVVARLAHLDALYHYTPPTPPTPTGLTTTTTTTTTTKYWKDQHLYIQRGKDCYDIYGRKITSSR